ncbi:hypothetical protein JX265_008981 [Neoarthrinium moseri]|uniref:Arylamine N-acetyltransferase n=1 Tax=Neoarthrinium moseri TaxID=1658444 RepID=A0A9P9WH13_9PEZI|nr:uncharacterized protein JN550_007851 [Neoarthrinium moseri]KAI1862935.1 hypothetical protein JX265_008981 [Neoarthrinium moseri]KAI1866162.1 hypothetical protein JN550_007851 [Neoarthrinium moseri]
MEQVPPPALTAAQISDLLTYIKLPKALHNAPPTPELLKTLHKYMIAACPYENLSLHYGPSHTINVDPQHMFRKIVVDNRGRGGYCMEVAILYNHLLRGLGFTAYTAGARTRKRYEGVPKGEYPGWVHITSIVSFPPPSPGAVPERYAVDVAFGGDGPTAPLPLVPGYIHQNLGAQQVRLVRDWIPAQVHRTEESKSWIYQYRNGEDREWNSYYCFTETEFTPDDWEVVNWYTSLNSNSFQTTMVLINKFLGRPTDDGEMEIYGKRMLVDGVAKENLGGKTQIIEVCNTEAERTAAIAKHFGILLTEDESNAIRGWRTEIIAKN